ncbi:hypothetical protein BGX26_000135 [Mortierella sp. AD094]|nr:hypothetical protein BGX26_000135 [Mortierella sp. AD094]
MLLGGPAYRAEVEQKSPTDPFDAETLSSPTSLAGAIDATAAYSSASQQQLSQSIADLIALESVIQSLKENDVSFDITDGSLGNPTDHYLGPTSSFAQLHGFINSPNQPTPIPVTPTSTPPYTKGQFYNVPAQAITVGHTPGLGSPFIYPLEQSSQQLHHSFGWTATTSNERDFSGPEPMDIQSGDHYNDIQLTESPVSASTQEKQSLQSMSSEVQSSETEEDSTAPATPTQCTNCETRTTPLWRRDEEGNSLCNACGLFLKLHGRVRPRSLKTDVIRKRNRGGINSKSTKRTQEKIREEEEDLDSDHPIKKGEDDHHRHRRAGAASQQSRDYGVDSVAEFAYTGEYNQYPNATPTADVATARRESILPHLDTRDSLSCRSSDAARATPSFDPLAAAAATMALFGQDEWSSLAVHFPSDSQESDMLSEEQQQRAVAMLLDEFRAKLTSRQ